MTKLFAVLLLVVAAAAQAQAQPAGDCGAVQRVPAAGSAPALRAPSVAPLPAEAASAGTLPSGIQVSRVWLLVLAGSGGLAIAKLIPSSDGQPVPRRKTSLRWLQRLRAGRGGETPER